MGANQNPPSERDWTPEEMEDFFSDKWKDAYNGQIASVMTNGADLSNKEPITLEKLLKTQHDLERLVAPRGIYITSIVHPEQGWPIVAHCDICHETVIVLSPYAIKPENGDYYLMNGTCLNEEEHIKHNMYPQKLYLWDEPKHFKFQPIYPIPHPVFPSYVEFEQEITIEEAKKRFPDNPIIEDFNEFEHIHGKPTPYDPTNQDIKETK